MILETLPVGPLQCNCSIIGDETSREAIVVDPGDDIPRILALLAKHNLTVKQIVITHAHIDHIAGAAKLKEVTGAPILYNQADLPLVAMMDAQAAWLGMEPPTVRPPDHSLADNEHVVIRGLHAAAIFPPGHTQGSLCLYLPEQKLLIAGDTLFAGSIGRTDLPGGNHHQIIASINGQLLTLAEDTRVLPGHGPETSL